MDTYCVDAAKARQEPNLTASPPRGVSKQLTSKPKKQSSVTPKRFKKFFTPSSSLMRGSRFGVSRLALGEITSSATNRKERRLPQKVTVASTTARMEDAAPRAEDLSKMQNGNTIAVLTDEMENPTRVAYDLPMTEHGNIVALTAGEMENATLEAEVPTMANRSTRLSSEEIPTPWNPLKRKRYDYYCECEEEADSGNDEEESDDEDHEPDTEDSEEEDEFAGLCQEDREEAMIEREIYEAYKDMRELYHEVEDEYEQAEQDALNEVKPVIRSKYRGLIGAISRRELDMPAGASRRSGLDYANSKSL